MKAKYKSEDIDLFYRHFKQLPEYFEMEKVLQIVHNPGTRIIKYPFYKPNYLFLMTTFIITAVAILTFYIQPGSKKQETIAFSKNQEKGMENSTYKDVSHTSGNTSCSSLTVFSEKKLSNGSGNPELNTTEDYTAPDQFQMVPSHCYLPDDSLYNKYDLFVHLSEAERARMGLFVIIDTFPKKTDPKLLFEKYGDHHVNGVSTSGNGKVSFKVFWDGFWISDTACTRYRFGCPFYSMIDTLVPVVYKSNIYWFEPTKSTFDSLPDRYKYLKDTYANLICLKRHYPNRKLVNYWSKDKLIVLDTIPYLELTKEELFNMGIDYNYNEGAARDSMKKGRPVYYFGPYPSTFMPIIITDNGGRKTRDKVNRNVSFPDKKLFNVLVPVKIPRHVNPPNYHNPNFDIFWDEYDIYWFNPTDSFINALPERIRYRLKTEKENILKGSNTTSGNCTFFESCRSTLQINDLKVFPNPATDRVNIQFSLNQDISGSISLTSMSGRTIKQFTGKEIMKAGFNSYELDITNISSGIYLITIYSDKGFKTTRLIIM